MTSRDDQPSDAADLVWPFVKWAAIITAIVLLASEIGSFLSRENCRTVEGEDSNGRLTAVKVCE